MESQMTTIDRLYGYDQNSLIPLDQLLTMGERNISTQKFTSEDELYHHTEQDLLKFLQYLENSSITPQLKEELIETVCLLLCATENYTTVEINIEEFYTTTPTDYDTIPKVFTTTPTDIQTLSDFTAVFGQQLPDETAKQFAKNRQQTIQEILFELIISSQDITDMTTQTECEKKIATIMLTIETSYSTQTFLEHTTEKPDTTLAIDSSSINIKTI